MKTVHGMRWFAAVTGMWVAVACAQPAPPPVAKMSAAECAVWNRERSFAASVANHDVAAFAEHVREDAVFDAGTNAPTRGRGEIVESFRDFIDGKGAILRWYPGVVNIGGDPGIAFSHGVFWLQDDNSSAKARFRTGSFTTIWVKGADGVWKVLFDSGGSPTVVVTADDIAKLVASLPKECPRR